LGAIGILLFFRFKRKAAKAAELALAREVYNNDQDKESKIQDEMCVDWDMIDNQFRDSTDDIEYHLSLPATEKPSIRTYSPNSYDHTPHFSQTSDVNLSLPSDSSSGQYRRTLLCNQHITSTSSLSNDEVLSKPNIGREI
jgi:hypothetical protein